MGACEWGGDYTFGVRHLKSCCWPLEMTLLWTWLISAFYLKDSADRQGLQEEAVWPAQAACPVPGIDVPSTQTKGFIPESRRRKLAVCIPGGFASIDSAVWSHLVHRLIFTVVSLRPALAHRFFIIPLFPSHSNHHNKSGPFSPPPTAKRKEHREKGGVSGKALGWGARGRRQLPSIPWRTLCWSTESRWDLEYVNLEEVLFL